MAIYWPTPGFKGRAFKLCILSRWDFNFCVRSRGVKEIQTDKTMKISRRAIKKRNTHVLKCSVYRLTDIWQKLISRQDNDDDNYNNNHNNLLSPFSSFIWTKTSCIRVLDIGIALFFTSMYRKEMYSSTLGGSFLYCFLCSRFVLSAWWMKSLLSKLHLFLCRPH